MSFRQTEQSHYFYNSDEVNIRKLIKSHVFHVFDKAVNIPIAHIDVFITLEHIQEIIL